MPAGYGQRAQFISLHGHAGLLDYLCPLDDVLPCNFCELFGCVNERLGAYESETFESVGLRYGTNSRLTPAAELTITPKRWFTDPLGAP